MPEHVEAGPFQFREVTRATGIDVRHDRSVFPDDGSGVAVGDLDGDGDDDLVFTQGLLRPLAVYRNDRRLRFALVQQDPVAGAGGTALALGDFDLDGDLDLAVAGRGRLDLMENVGDLRFRSRTPGTGLAVATSMGSVGVGTGALVADLDLDGMLDVAVVSRLGPEVFRNGGAGGSSPRPSPWACRRRSTGSRAPSPTPTSPRTGSPTSSSAWTPTRSASTRRTSRAAPAGTSY